MMKKGWATAFAASMLALVLVSTPAVSAAEDEPLQGAMDAAFDLTNYPACREDDSCFWVGTVSGDLVGGIEIHELWDQNYVVGKPGALLGIEHFFETFTIDLGSGRWVSGVDAGVWNQETGKFRANGWVMDASAGL
ncbi:MAG TPA: hypothetical protein VKO45_07675, partial [Methanomicrobiales archaeon]|nr:hypothetical protein [Methanomicrobiales archaeon]